MEVKQAMQPAATIFALDDLRIGQRAQFDTVITHEDVDAFANVSGDTSPLHVDAGFARDRGFADRVVHGAHLVALASRLVGMYLPGQNALLLTVNVAFVTPVLPGTQLTVSGIIEQVSDTVRSIILKLRMIESSTGATVARGRLTVGFTDAGRMETSVHG
jgi:3-hydroxybutyryl-CoA dehydratase